MRELLNPSKRIKYTHYVEYRGKEYIREENMIPKAFRWEGSDKLEDIHTIAWRDRDENTYQYKGNVQYYSCDHGWAKNRIMDKSNPIPAIEKAFKKSIGKNLIYFNLDGNE